ncbi:hypothetical protein LCGC14_1645020, partial [marine sediment metagenome]
MKTQEQIDEQIRLLEEARPGVRPFSVFGDDNLAQVDAMITVLEEGLDEGDVWN